MSSKQVRNEFNHELYNTHRKRINYVTSRYRKEKKHYVVKGQLISKCPLGVIVWTKIPMKKFDKFCPRMGRAEFVKFFVFFQTMTPKGHFEIK